MATQVTTFSGVFWVMLVFCLAYFPTVGLTNSITMQSVKDPGRDFPPIRVLGTLGFIVAVSFVSLNKLENSSGQFMVGAAAAVVMAIYSITSLPHTPPPALGQKVTWQRAVGLDTLSMMKQTNFMIFIVASILACIPLTFYYSFANAYLNDLRVPNAGFIDDARSVGGSRDAAGDARALQIREHPGGAAAGPRILDAPLRAARLR